MYPNTAHLLRNQFLLNPDVIYLNHGSFGATPRPVFEAYQHWQRELESQPTEFFGRRANALLNQSRESLARYLGTNPPNVCFVTNATTGINVIVRGMKLNPGDEVLSSNHEYGALDRTWRFIAGKQGFRYINRPVDLPVTTPAAFVEDFWAGVTDKTRVIYLSQITSPTALIFPVKEICRRARAQGILTVIDGAHAPGQIPLNLDEIGADFYSGNLHKWLCAPKGAGFLYARPELHAMIEPLVVSWGYQSDRPGVSPLIDYVEFQGTRDLSAFLAVEDAIRFYEEHNWDQVRAQCHALTVETHRKISEWSGEEPISPLSGEWFSQMASAPLPNGTDAARLHDELYNQYHIEIPVLDFQGRKLVRLSFQGYNTPEDASTLLDALKQLLPR